MSLELTYAINKKKNTLYLKYSPTDYENGLNVTLANFNSQIKDNSSKFSIEESPWVAPGNGYKIKDTNLYGFFSGKSRIPEFIAIYTIIDGNDIEEMFIKIFQNVSLKKVSLKSFDSITLNETTFKNEKGTTTPNDLEDIKEYITTQTFEEIKSECVIF